jgi:RNA polymerase sigma-70 factor (ECF subfamily)
MNKRGSIAQSEDALRTFVLGGSLVAREAATPDPVTAKYLNIAKRVGEHERHTARGVIGKSDNEAAMIASILAGHSQVYHDLIRPHERSVFMMALSFVKNEADAEEIAQEAFLKAFCNLSAFRAESKFSTWLISIALNEARSRLRRQTIVRMESLDVPLDDGGAVSPALLRDWREIPSEAVERQEIRQMLQEAVIGLPLIYRQVFQLRDVTELSIQETAETLGISAACVKVRLHRARMMLQKRLSPLLQSVKLSGVYGERPHGNV